MSPVIVIAFVLYLAIALGLRWFAGINLSSWQYLGLFALSYIVVKSVAILFSNDEDENEPSTMVKPSGRLANKPLICMVLGVGSGILSGLNPFQLVQQFAQLFGQLKMMLSFSAPMIDTYEQKNAYSLPFRDEFYAIKGGVTKKSSHSWDVLTQRYAYDFVILDQGGTRHSGKGTQKEEYYCYGKEIIAVADGVVVKVKDGIRDSPFLGLCMRDIFARDFIGNHVIIEHEGGEFSFYAHLIPGSTTLREGEKIEQGALVGLCGNSGHSSEPHLHFHVQDRKDFYSAFGLPIKFSDIVVNGTNITEPYYLSEGETVKNGL